MKKSKLWIQAFLVGIGCLSTSARAGIVYYTISNPGDSSTESGYADLQVVNVKIDGVDNSGTFAGGIQITESGGPAAGVPTQYTTICTDINGTLYLGNTYAYDTPVNAFSSSTGIGPSWGALNGPGLTVNNAGNAAQSIQNAAYLFYHDGGLTSAGITGTADQMAGLQLAIWEVLYDTTANGKVVVDGSSRFQVLAGGDATAISDANGYIADLNNQLHAGGFGYAGFLLFPNPATDLNGTPYSNTHDGQPPQELLIAVPEPSTILAGAMVLLPFGASTFRILRRSRKA